MKSFVKNSFHAKIDKLSCYKKKFILQLLNSFSKCQSNIFKPYSTETLSCIYEEITTILELERNIQRQFLKPLRKLILSRIIFTSMEICYLQSLLDWVDVCQRERTKPYPHQNIAEIKRATKKVLRFYNKLSNDKSNIIYESLQFLKDNISYIKTNWYKLIHTRVWIVRSNKQKFIQGLIGLFDNCKPFSYRCIRTKEETDKLISIIKVDVNYLQYVASCSEKGYEAVSREDWENLNVIRK